ncbi:hypothetical protein DDE05_31275 [Streptomyces cavourensis]|nr:hypothetical protein DDE05_31275 [Streptomyces cavourensis]
MAQPGLRHRPGNLGQLEHRAAAGGRRPRQRHGNRHTPGTRCDHARKGRDNQRTAAQAYPQGFALDDTHRPHITVIQRFVRTADLDKVYAAANDVLAQSKVRQMRLEAFRYFYLPSGATGLAAIVARPTPALLALQADLLAAVAPYTAETGDSTAFVTTPEDPVIDPVLIAYVSTYDSIAAGRKYSPHVTTGVALKADLDKMLAEPFEAFSFAPAGAAVYQLGQFGTASKKLKQLDFPK